ncbi:MAG: glycerol-3-phosphate responsive antiterminator [Tissierellia bacterium]|mgnify:CR=1 FL=1|nr:glycerol-3-phosphate responsive antiterminator [Tissierellia bacterium]
MHDFFKKIEANPIIASVNNLEQLEAAIDSPCRNIFLLAGNIFNLKEIAYRVKTQQKGLYIQVDLIDGFSKDTWGLEYIVKNIYPDGIITVKPSLVKMAKDLGAFIIYRAFINNSMLLEKEIQSIRDYRPNVVEILPGIMPKIIDKVHLETNIPIVAGGLIMDHDDIAICLDSKAIALSTSNKGLWYDG